MTNTKLEHLYVVINSCEKTVQKKTSKFWNSVTCKSACSVEFTGYIRSLLSRSSIFTKKVTTEKNKYLKNNNRDYKIKRTLTLSDEVIQKYRMKLLED